MPCVHHRIESGEDPMNITAAVLREPCGPFSMEQLELAAPNRDEVLVRIVSTGLCHTDIAARDQLIPVPLPIVLGHEGAGIVEAVGSEVTGLAVGDHVVLSFASCGHCGPCHTELPGYCTSFMPLNFFGARADGSTALRAGDESVASHFFGQSSFASYALANERNAIKVAKDVSLELLSPLGCGIQTGAGSIMQALACPAGSSLLVLGGGSVGLSAVLGAVVQGCSTIIVVEPMAARRTMALELGATHVIDPAMAAGLGESARAVVPAGVDFILDTTGKTSVINAAVAAIAHRGTLGLLAVPASAADASLSVEILTLLGLGYRIKGITEGDVNPASFIPRMIELYLAGKFPFDKLISRYPLSEINRAIDEQHRGLSIKPVLIP
jgi:aryl-alcohol dehydrogenase